MKARFETFSIVRILSVLILIAASFILLSINARAQCPGTELISGLRDPLGTAFTNQGNLLVSENGTYPVLNSGRISIVDPVNGNRRTLLDGLPSAVNDANEQSGPHGIVMRGRTLYVAIGVGDVGLAGPIPMSTVIPNPNPTSQLYSSVLAIQFSANVEMTTTGFHLTTANQQTLANGQKVELSYGGGNNVIIQMIANFPDYIPFPLPFFEGNIQTSNPFHMYLKGNTLYVTDGGRNLTWKVDVNSGSYSEFVSFPDIPNSLFPAFGGPFIQSVPTGIASTGNQIYVSLFRGFPFPAGSSTIQEVDPQTGNNNAFISGLRTAIGIIHINELANTDYLVLQHTSGQIIIPAFTEPGLVLYFDSPTDPPIIVADCLTKPSSMALNKVKGKLYVSERAGRVVVLNISSVLSRPGKSNVSKVSGTIPNEIALGNNYPNPFNPSTTIGFKMPFSGNVSLKIYDLRGSEVAVLVNEFKTAGSYEVKFDASQLSSGTYFYRLQAGEFVETKKLLLMK